MLTSNYLIKVYDSFSKKNEGKEEYLKVIKEFLESIEILVDKDSSIEKEGIVERFLEPERYIEFRVSWLDDNNKVNVNKGFRVQYNSVLGPYKGGLRFHESVNESIIKLLGFEQSLKNSLTGLLIGGAKGGSDFNPKNKSDKEIMRFCQSFISELAKHIGDNIDIPSGDIGVSSREIGYLFGQYKKIKNEFNCVLTNKGLSYGGTKGRKEATGFGLIYFANIALNKLLNTAFKDKKVIISGSGNVALYALKKVSDEGAKVVAMSDSDGCIYDEEGIDFNILKDIKEANKLRIKEYLKYSKTAKYIENSKDIWKIKCDIALPCATQYEIDLEDIKTLVNNGLIALFEGSNKALETEAINYLNDNNILYGPSKATNAGGVIVSVLEMSQNSSYLKINQNEVFNKLKDNMEDIFNKIYIINKEYNLNKFNLLQGANIVAFNRIKEASIEQGVI